MLVLRGLGKPTALPVQDNLKAIRYPALQPWCLFFKKTPEEVVPPLLNSSGTSLGQESLFCPSELLMNQELLELKPI